jgi:hypothetical protein
MKGREGELVSTIVYTSYVLEHCEGLVSTSVAGIKFNFADTLCGYDEAYYARAIHRMATAGKHICFYSNKCEWSRAFITELKDTPYKSEFEFICVDASPNRPQLPSWLKKVPTLVIRGEPEPRVDGDVMNWLFLRKLQDTNNKGGARSGGSPSAGPGDSVEAFSMMEMGHKFSDMYSLIDDDTSVEGNGGASFQHSFSFLNGAGPGSQGAQQATLTNHDPKRSKKEEMMDKQMEQYMKSRDMGMPQRIMRQ